jgi:hypothetical protein
MEGWTDFYVAAVGGSAALAGLLVVAISINIAQIMKFPLLPGRAAQTIIKTGAALVICSLGLFPNQAPLLFGIETLGIGLAVAAMGLRNFIASLNRRGDDDPLMWTLLPVVMDVATVAPTIIGGVLLIAGNPSGLYWIGVGIIISFISALENGWVLLVEILR